MSNRPDSRGRLAPAPPRPDLDCDSSPNNDDRPAVRGTNPNPGAETGPTRTEYVLPPRRPYNPRAHLGRRPVPPPPPRVYHHLASAPVPPPEAAGPSHRERTQQETQQERNQQVRNQQIRNQQDPWPEDRYPDDYPEYPDAPIWPSTGFPPNYLDDPDPRRAYYNNSAVNPPGDRARRQVEEAEFVEQERARIRDAFRAARQVRDAAKIAVEEHAGDRNSWIEQDGSDVPWERERRKRAEALNRANASVESQRQRARMTRVDLTDNVPGR